MDPVLNGPKSCTSTHPGLTQSVTDPSHTSTQFPITLNSQLVTEQHLEQVLYGASTMELDTNTNAYKRTRSSPISSPLRLTQSPMPKVRRRLCTGNEKQPTAPLLPNKWQKASYNHASSPIEQSIFKISEEERLVLET